MSEQISFRKSTATKQRKYRAYNNTTGEQEGPVEGKLKSFGDILGLVVGQMGECSQDLQSLLLKFADEKFTNLSRSQGLSFGKDMRMSLSDGESHVFICIQQLVKYCTTRYTLLCKDNHSRANIYISVPSRLILA